MPENREILGLPPAAGTSSITRGPLWASLLVHGLVIALVFSVTFPQAIRQHRYRVTPVFAPAAERVQHPRNPVRPLPAPLPAAPLRVFRPVLKAQPAAVILPAPEAVVITPKIPQPVSLPLLEAPRPMQTVDSGFAAGSYQVHQPAPRHDPPAVALESNSTVTENRAAHPGPIAAAGFNGPTGSSGTDRRAPASIATGGFGESQGLHSAAAGGVLRSGGGGFAPAAAASPAGSAKPRTAGGSFESMSVQPAAPTSLRRESASGAFTPLEILQKPRPVYSEEARRLQLEGEVVLKVQFGVQGRIKVLGVVHGLGHGLDETAIQAASAIRFRPATENGTPVNTVAVIRIAFQLAY